MLNSSRISREVILSLSDKMKLIEAKDIWNVTPIHNDNTSVALTIGDRDAAIIKLN